MDHEPFDALDRGILGLIALYEEIARNVPEAAPLAAIPDREKPLIEAGSGGA
jgi:hypothetical protein